MNPIIFAESYIDFSEKLLFFKIQNHYVTIVVDQVYEKFHKSACFYQFWAINSETKKTRQNMSKTVFLWVILILKMDERMKTQINFKLAS